MLSHKGSNGGHLAKLQRALRPEPGVDGDFGERTAAFGRRCSRGPTAGLHPSIARSKANAAIPFRIGIDPVRRVAGFS
jgi:hypothetical protein